MKKFLVLIILAVSLLSCDKIDNEPKREQGTMSKEYKLPDPTNLTPEQRQEYNQRNEEYQNNVIKN